MFLVEPISLSNILGDLIELLILVIIVDTVIYYLIAFGTRVSLQNPFVRTIRSIANPVLEPIRKLLPPRNMQGWDLSPMITIIVLQWIRNWIG